MIGLVLNLGKYLVPLNLTYDLVKDFGYTQ